MTIQGPDPRHDRGLTQPTDEHRSHGNHRLMMIVCCIPMLVIAGVLVATGVAGSGFIVAALACTAMMAAMMFMMPSGRP